MRKLFSILFFIPLLAFSQRPEGAGQGQGQGHDMPEIGVVKGKVLDAKTSKPIEYAVISLIRMKDSAVVNGATSNSNGEFEISKIKFGRYRVKVSFMGYKSKRIDSVSINPKKIMVDIGSILMNESVNTMQTFTVTADRDLMTMGIDKKIFNVEKSLVSDGGSATDVLKNIPSVTVDIDGNVNLRNSGNVTILIDGRPSSLIASGATDALEQIPASSIESIEVITNPSAKYDADGTAGILNIILKKSKTEGFNGQVSMNVGTKDKYNFSSNLNYHNDKFNIYGSYSFRDFHSISIGNSYRHNTLADTSYYMNQLGTTNNITISHTGKAGVDYNINDYNVIGASINLSSRDNTRNQRTEYQNQDMNEVLKYLSFRDADNKSTGMNVDYALNYRHKFKNPLKTLMFDAIYSTTTNNQNVAYVSQPYLLDYTPTGIPSDQRSTSDNKNSILTLSGDFANPFKGDAKLETGVKSVIRGISQNYLYENYIDSTKIWTPEAASGNNFDYQSQVHAAYATFSNKWKNFGYQLGARVEDALTSFTLKTTDSTYKRDYLNLFPSVHVSYQLPKDQQIQLSYTRRVNRPNTRQINPFVDKSDPLNYFIGNPKLNPEYINSFELNYVKMWKKATLTSSVFYRKTVNMITYFRSIVNDSVSSVTFQNLASATSYGFEFVGMVTILPWWRFNGEFDFYESKIDATNIQADLNSNSLVYVLKGTSNMKLPKIGDLQIVGQYESPQAVAYGTSYHGYSVDAAVKRDIIKNKLSFNFRVSDVFNTKKFTVYQDYGLYKINSLRRRDSRTFFITLTYKFGKLDNKQEKPKKRQDENSNDMPQMDEM